MTKRWLSWLGAVAMVVAAATAALGLWLQWLADPASGTRDQVGIAAPIAVYRDDWSVPHIFAASSDDASFALGWVHAEDRLWQMETMRRVGAGRLAEIVGSSGLVSDRWMRTLGVHRLAEAQYPQLGEATRRALDAYARGVNAWLASRGSSLPLEFLVLGLRPEPWSPVDSLVWLKLMALRLSSDWREELLRSRLTERLTPEQLHDLWPDATPPVAPGAASLAPTSMLAQLDAVVPRSLQQEHGASNVWAATGPATADGKPILANDPHLPFALPGVWYLARLATPAGELAGATSPGFPAMILGHNGRIAWGLTTSEIDVEDLFVERVDAADPTRYLAPGGSLPFVVREEVIRVRGGEPETLTVRLTRHGPVISDLAGLPSPVANAAGAAEEGVVMALAAPYLEADDLTAEALFAVNAASDWAGFIAAARATTSPQQNVFYADRDGHIGYVAAGRIPWRGPGGGWLPRVGWTGADDWRGFMPFEDQPQAYDPPSGRLVNANNAPARGDSRQPIAGTWDPGFRAERIEQRLSDDPLQTLGTSAALQMDSVSLMARRLLPLMLERLPAGMAHRPIIDLLANWRFDMDRNRPEPLMFAAWLRELVRNLCADELGPLFERYWDYRPRFVELALTRQPLWCDDIGTPASEDCPSRLQASLEAAMSALTLEQGSDPAAWRWGDVHEARFEHSFWQRIPVIGGLAGAAFAVDGGNDTINRAASRIASAVQPFAAVHGAGFRGVYDLADPGRSRFVVANGQSANPLSRHYRDMSALWRSGEGVRLDASREALEREAASRLLLLPKVANRP